MDFSKLLVETIEKQIRNFLPAIEKSFNIKIQKTLGESSGVAFLTSDNKVLKISSADVENIMCYNLWDDPHPNFTKVFDIESLSNYNKAYRDWYIILKEFIPNMPNNIHKQYNQLEKNVIDWATLNYTNIDRELFFPNFLLVIEDDLFFEYIDDLSPELNPILSDLKNIADYAIKYNQKHLDIYDENLGYKDEKLIAFDF
jgi:hypothetical protein